ERSSPDLHIVFHRTASGEREAWAHFDLHGPQNTLLHLTEVLRNRLTFGRTSEYEVYSGLVRRDPQSLEPLPPPRYDLSEHAKQYLRSTFAPETLGVGAALSAAGTALRGVVQGEPSENVYSDRVVGKLARNVMAKSIDFGASAFLQQEQA